MVQTAEFFFERIVSQRASEMGSVDFVTYDMYKSGVKSSFWSKMPLAIHNTTACVGLALRERL